MAEKLLAVKGMNDILPLNSHHWLWLEQQIRDWLMQYGYSNLRTPIVESTQLFTRSIGEVTDIVEKEMYSFTDSLNGDRLTLRPEGTAGVIRAVVEHNLLYNANQKLWYIGPMFRHERPQKGRYRQFHQLGVEALGFAGPDIDCEMILMLQQLWVKLGLTGLELQINCLGNQAERMSHRKALIDYLLANQSLLDDESNRRLQTNPLRILDSKNPQLHGLLAAAPRLIDYLTADSMQHYAGWKAGLSALGIAFVENPRLVRGLDYYNLSVFEWVSTDLGAQSTLCGGGRYDPLISELGGRANYAIGFGLGLERLLLSLEAQGKLPETPGVDIYVVNSGEGAACVSFRLARELRQAGYSVMQNFGGGNFKAQFKKAAIAKARLAIVIGENEVQENQVVVKCMEQQTQHVIEQAQLLTYIESICSDSVINRVVTIQQELLGRANGTSRFT